MAGISRAEANARLKTLNIRGKEYADVAQRIIAFWDVFPEGAFKTEWLVLNEDWCVCMMHVYNMGVEIATGTASEVKAASAINKTSYIENCETSALGRALGFLGIGTDGAVASAQEVLWAMQQQREHEKRQQDKRGDQNATEQEPELVPENPGLVELASARSAYETALRDYCRRTGKDASELRKQQEAHFNAPWTSWSVDLLNSMADKFPKEVAK